MGSRKIVFPTFNVKADAFQDTFHGSGYIEIDVSNYKKIIVPKPTYSISGTGAAINSRIFEIRIDGEQLVHSDVNSGATIDVSNSNIVRIDLAVGTLYQKVHRSVVIAQISGITLEP